MDDGLAAGDEGQRGRAVLMGLRDGGEEAACVARGAAQAACQHDWRVAKAASGCLRGGAELAHAAGDVGLDVGERFRRFPRQKRECMRGEVQIVFLHDRQRLRAGGAVRTGGTGGDHVQRVAQNIGQDDGKDLRRETAFGEPAALDGGQALAQGIHLHDICAAGQQLPGDIGHLIRRDERTFKQRRTAAGKEEENRILRPQAAHHLQRAGRRPVGVVIRDGMTGLIDLERADRPLTVAVFRDDGAARYLFAQCGTGCVRHLPCGLAGGNEDQPALRCMKLRQRAAHRGVRQRIGQRFVNDGLCVLSECLHKTASFEKQYKRQEWESPEK